MPSHNQVIGTVVIAALSLYLGYVAGVSRKRASKFTMEEPKLRQSHAENNTSDDSDSDTSSLDGDGSGALEIEQGEECKLVLLVRTDLGMTAGKIAAQCSHATLACYKTLVNSNPALLQQWERSGQRKIALRCSDEDELLLLQAQAQSLKLCARSIQDAGRTQIASGSRTVLGILGPSRLVNQLTGALRLL